MCRTHAQNTRIIKELNKIFDFLSENKSTIKINGLSIRGRNEMCLNKTLLSLKLSPKESMSVCLDMRKNRTCTHFLKLLKQKDKLENPILIAPEILDKPIDAEELINLCKEKNYCPYFLSKFLLSKMRIIICNYQWVFNPYIRENFMQFIDKELKDCLVVLDECHNVIDVATEVNSERITPYSLRLCLRDLELYRSPSIMQRFIKILMSNLDEKKSRMRAQEVGVDPESLLDSIITKLGLKDLNQFINFLQDMHEFSVSIHEEKLANGQFSRDYVGTLADFWLKWIDTYHQNSYFFSYAINRRNQRSNIALETIALDPRETVIPILKECYASVHLSGTVNPRVYNNLMGFKESGKNYKGIIAESPFNNKNVKAIIAEGVDTRKDNRIPSMYKKIISKIGEVISVTPGNVGIFCASYRILNSLMENGIKSVVEKSDKKLFIEEPGLSASENALLVNEFKSFVNISKNGAVLLGVCGGRNSEGEDYPGDHMNSVIVAGFPYHLPTPRVEAKIKYYDKVFNRQGWNFAYLYPAVQRANQASGRPIRKISDKGAIIFMDQRFKAKLNWISEWIRKEVEFLPDIENSLLESLQPFWNQP